MGTLCIAEAYKRERNGDKILRSVLIRGSPQRVLERCNMYHSDGAHFSFMWLKQCILIATRMSKSFNVVFKHCSDPFHCADYREVLAIHDFRHELLKNKKT